MQIYYILMRLQDLKPHIIINRQAKHRKDGFPAMPWHLSGIRPELLSLTGIRVFMSRKFDLLNLRTTIRVYVLRH